MAAHTTLVKRWQSRLDENERLAVDGPAQRQWLPRIYARIYRFLLSCYGDGDWRADDASNVSTERSALEDHTDGVAGAAPKSVEQIRSALGAIHEACGEGADPGPLTDGHLRDDDWIAVSSESALVSPVRCVRLLQKHNLKAMWIRRGDDTIVVVHAGQREQAMNLIKKNRETLRIRTRRAWWIGTACLGTLIGTVLGLPAIVVCIMVMRTVDRQSGVCSDEVRVLIGVAVIFSLFLFAAFPPLFRKRDHV